MFSRKMSVPAAIICRIVSDFSEAGPSVQMIRVLRIALRIQARKVIARRFRNRHLLTADCSDWEKVGRFRFSIRFIRAIRSASIERALRKSTANG